jgi:hypothetical protein
MVISLEIALRKAEDRSFGSSHMRRPAHTTWVGPAQHHLPPDHTPPARDQRAAGQGPACCRREPARCCRDSHATDPAISPAPVPSLHLPGALAPPARSPRAAGQGPAHRRPCYPTTRSSLAPPARGPRAAGERLMRRWPCRGPSPRHRGSGPPPTALTRPLHSARPLLSRRHSQLLRPDHWLPVAPRHCSAQPEFFLHHATIEEFCCQFWFIFLHH